MTDDSGDHNTFEFCIVIDFRCVVADEYHDDPAAACLKFVTD